jgi:hypothetical protein
LTGEIPAIAQELLTLAISKGKLPREFIESDRKGKYGSCLNYDLYDMKGATVLLQRRDCTMYKGYWSPVKSYYLLRKMGKSVQVIKLDDSQKAIACKAAKMAIELGDAINSVQKKRLPKQKPYLGYKVLDITTGTPRSVYDGSEWPIGQTRVQRVRQGHNGGFYWYQTEDEARRLTETFNREWISGKRLGLFLVQADGQHTVYKNNRASSRVTVLEQIASFVSRA